MSLYDFDAVQPSAIPDSLTPVYIDYLARHGARYLTSESKIKSVEKALLKARETRSITRAGEECLKLMESVRATTNSQWGMLSPIGVEQERRLAAEMAAMYPSVFKNASIENKNPENEKGDSKAESPSGKNKKAPGYGSPQLAAVASYVPRVVETMDHFTIGLTRAFPGLQTDCASGRQYDFLTRYFVADKAYDDWREHGAWQEVYDDFFSRLMPEEPARRLVGDRSGLSSKELKNFPTTSIKSSRDCAPWE